MKKIVILGAGPAGLASAYEIVNNSNDYEIEIIEKDNQVGGLSKTYEFDGNRVDIGGHRYFTKNTRVQKIWNNVLSTSSNKMLTCERNSHILFNEKMFKYPLQLNYQMIKSYGIFNSFFALLSYLHSCLCPREEKSLEDYYINLFGKRLYLNFFKDYTEKLWGIGVDELSNEWGNQRVQGISLVKMIKKETKGEARTLINNFSYPSFGSGSFWDLMASDLNKLNVSFCFNSSVVEIEKKDKFVITCNKNNHVEKIYADILISSIPLSELFYSLTNCPKNIKTIAEQLNYRDMIIVAFTVSKEDLGKNIVNNINDNWIYVQDRNLHIGRVQILNNWSIQMVKNNNEFLLEAEIFCNQNDSMWLQKDKSLCNLVLDEFILCQFLKEKAQINSKFVKRIEKAYPVYDEKYEHIKDIQEWINKQNNLYCIGRNGQHHYNNMDHSMETGLIASDIILGIEKDKKRVWNVNTNKEYIEEK